MAPANCGLEKRQDSVVATAEKFPEFALDKHRPEDMHVYQPN